MSLISHLRVSAFALLAPLSSGIIFAADAPLGVILAARSATIQPKGINSEFAASPGRALRAGDILRTGEGSVRFLFCPDLTVQTLQAKQELAIPASHLPATPGQFADARKLPACDLPSTGRLPASDLPAAGASSAPQVDILDTLQKSAVLARGGKESDAAGEIARIGAAFPEAVWARGVTVPPAPAGAGFGGKTYALLIGISQYPKEMEPTWRSLRFARADAQAFADFLISAKGGGIAGDQIQMLLDGKATRDAIDAAIKTINEKARGEKNTLILFVASHGFAPDPDKTNQPEPYIVTADAYKQDVKTTGYPMAEFRTLIAKETQEFGRVIAYVDICHAAMMHVASGKQDLEPAVKAVFDDGRTNVGVLLAAKGNAYEAPQFGNHGAFTYSVLKGLNGDAQPTHPPAITLGDLFDYVLHGVRGLTAGKQQPDTFGRDELIILDDITRTPGIDVPVATKMVSADLRGAFKEKKSAPRPLAEREERQASAFEALAHADPLGAIAEYRRIEAGPATTPDAQDHAAQTLRVALEEHGQQILIRYLHGEQLAPQKPEFDLRRPLLRGGRQTAPSHRLRR